MIHDHHEGYINWQQFVANRERLAANRTNSEGLPGPAREGLCLLQGLLICGCCGRRLTVRYSGNNGIYPMYECGWRRREAVAARTCLSVPAPPLDQAITERLLSAITPLTIELALTALTDLEQRDEEMTAQWRMRIERARYEAELAERRYEAVDPTNRLIAATLEQRWNDAMQRLQDLQVELTGFERRTKRAVTAEQKQQIRQLAENFPQLWAASTTTARDRKRILRLLVNDVTISKAPEPKTIRLHIRWRGGATETLDVAQRPNRADAVRYPVVFVARIRELAATLHDEEIVDHLNAEGCLSSTGKPFTQSMIKFLRSKHQIPSPPPPDGTLSVRQVCDKYDVSHWVVYYWIEIGLVTATRRKPTTPYAITITETSDKRLREWIAHSCHLEATSRKHVA
jgi:hypothetical protein